MKFLSLLLTLLFVTYLEAQVKWIPIEQVKSKKSSETNIGISDKKIRELQPIKKIVENAKIIQHLLDDKKKKKNENEKNWYIIENVQSN